MDSGLPVSPLANTQNLGVYGMASMEAEHMQAVYALVHGRGGLERITLDGLPEVLEVYDQVAPKCLIPSLIAAVSICVTQAVNIRLRNSRGAMQCVLRTYTVTIFQIVRPWTCSNDSAKGFMRLPQFHI